MPTKAPARTPRKIADILFPPELESRRDEIADAAAADGIGAAYLYVYARGMQHALATAPADPSANPPEVVELERGWTRYEKLRKLSPRAYAELHARNLAGERFDDLVDALPQPSTPIPGR